MNIKLGYNYLDNDCLYQSHDSLKLLPENYLTTNYVDVPSVLVMCCPLKLDPL